jgi:hypothetical protein
MNHVHQRTSKRDSHNFEPSVLRPVEYSIEIGFVFNSLTALVGGHLQRNCNINLNDWIPNLRRRSMNCTCNKNGYIDLSSTKNFVEIIVYMEYTFWTHSTQRKACHNVTFFPPCKITSPIDMNRTYQFIALNLIFMETVQLRSGERDTQGMLDTVELVRQFWCNEREIHTALRFCVVTDV